jgi:hypothetical protein
VRRFPRAPFAASRARSVSDASAASRSAWRRNTRGTEAKVTTVRLMRNVLGRDQHGHCERSAAIQNAAFYPLALIACTLARSADAIASRIRVTSVW